MSAASKAHWLAVLDMLEPEVLFGERPGTAAGLTRARVVAALEREYRALGGHGQPGPGRRTNWTNCKTRCRSC